MSDPRMDAPEQCIILVGGRGTRLGAMTADCPKPLLPVSGRPFLDELIWHAGRFGFGKVLLLAGYRAEKVLDYVRRRSPDARLRIEVVVEPEPLGTAGALSFAGDKLDPYFLLLNGDSLFDFNWLDLVSLFAGPAASLIAMSLRWEADAFRFGVACLDGEHLTSFRDRGEAVGGLVNGGVYLATRDLLHHLPSKGSLERDVLPDLAKRGKVSGRVEEGFFLDIGTPGAYAAAQQLLPSNRIRPGLFLDRDGVLNRDHGYVHRIDDFHWMPGAIDAVKAANDQHRFVFVITNQAGVARGYYTEAQVRRLHNDVQRVVRAHGAHIDDFRYCPFHPDGVVKEYAKRSTCRKPEPGMILDLLEHWPVDKSRSIVVGDEQTDIDAADRAGLRGCLYRGGNLADFIAKNCP